MKSIEIIRKFIGSNYVLDRVAREVFERLPLRLRYRLYYGKTFLYWSAFLRESEYWDKEKLEAFQIEQLKALLEHAAQNVPYYKKLFVDYGFKPERLQCLDDIKTLPYLTKEMVRDRANDFVATTVPKEDLIKTTTGGSTGIPLVIYKTRESRESSQAFLLNLLSRVGYSPKKKVAFFQWRDINMGNRKNMDFLRYGNKLVLSAANINNNEWMHKYYGMIMRFKPEFISGYVTIVLALAFFIKEQGLSPFNYMKAAFAYAETLYPWQRRIIEEAFGTRVFTSYGMYEGVIFGGECEHSNQYHIYPQYGITEFVDIDGGNKEIAGSGFGNYAMPLIRYRTMDIGVKGAEKCDKCNSNYPLIATIGGRIKEFLVNKDGRIFYTAMAGIDTDIFKNVKQFQFYQDEPGIACLKIVKRSTYSDSDTLLIEKEINKRFNTPESGIEIKIVFVDNIERSPSGKILMTDQRLDIKDFIKL